MLVGGIDEAGRGPVVGPMVVAGIVISDSDIDYLVKLGVKDSKKLSQKTRSKLLPEILSRAQEVVVEYIPPSLIDRYVLNKLHGGLNQLEVEVIASIIMRLSASKIIVDVPDVKPERFRRRLLERIDKGSKVRLVVAHHADEKFPVVSAASIIAKVFRDEIIRELHGFYGDFGSGYPSDSKTRAFIDYCITKGHLPPVIRKSWATLKSLRSKFLQTTLNDFL